MSYDLYFRPRSGSFTDETFRVYFCDRPNYKCEGSQAWYSNEDTGVYFIFELETEQQQQDDDNVPVAHFPVSLNINYLRPSNFILEAEREVTAFVEHFDLLVFDPQIKGMGDGEYNAERLVLGWNYGNEFAYASILKNERDKREIFHLPTEQLHNAWRWNMSRSQVQINVGESKFVPKIMFIDLGGSTLTAAVWPDGIPVVLPRVDYLFVPRKDLAPTKFFRKKEDTTLVGWDVAFPVLIKHGTQNEDGSFTLNYLTPPPDMAKFIKSLPADSGAVVSVSADRVLDREMYERSIV
jgi:hypothetical protein